MPELTVSPTHEDATLRGVTAGRPPHDRHQELHAEQVRLLYGQSVFALASVGFNAILLAVVMWGQVSAPVLGGWLMFTLGLTLGRYLLVRAYYRANPAPPEAGRWARWFLLGTALSGLGWGAAGGLFFTEDSHIHQVFLAFLLAGMSAGGTSTLSVYPGAYPLFLLPALLPYTVQVMSQSGTLYTAMALMVLLFIGMMLATSRRLYLTVYDSLKLRFANLDLLTNLAQAKERQEAVNRELAAEVADRVRAEAALQEHEALVQAVINSLPASIAVIDRAGRVIGINDAWQRSAQARTDPLLRGIEVGSNYLLACQQAIVRDRIAGQLPAAVEAVLAGTGPEFTAEYPGKRRDHTAWFIVSVSPLKSAQGGAVISHINITERKLAEERLLLAAVFRNTNEGILILDTRAKIAAINKAFTRITGFTPKDVLLKTPAMLVSDRQGQGRAFCRQLWRSLRRTGQWQGEIWACRENGEAYPAWLGANTIRDESGALTSYVAVFSDITQLKEAEEHLYELAYKDTLTGLPNRALFRERLQHALAHAHRSGSRVALMFLDLDRFKFINDTLGHDIGDRLLKQVAIQLKHCVRESDTVARLGGDEFTVILERVDEGADAAGVAQKIAWALSQPLNVDDHEIYTSASIGISLYPDDGDTESTLVRNADTAMYRAKEQGRAGYQFYSAEMNVYSRERLWLDANLRRAIERKELRLHYQPLVSIVDGTPKRVEALLRWHHSERGWIPPAEFIPLAEDTGLIAPLSEWVLREACEKGGRWHWPGSQELVLAVNLSAHQLRQQNLVPLISRVLDETGLAPSRLELELTESQLMQSTEAAMAILRELKTLGVRIAIDDFGTGYSSLSYLRRFPVDAVKIDRSFIADITTDPDDAAIARAVIAMAHTLKLEVVAEGVETAEQLALLRDWQCDTAQGYYFSYPLTGEDLTRLLARSV